MLVSAARLGAVLALVLSFTLAFGNGAATSADPHPGSKRAKTKVMMRPPSEPYGWFFVFRTKPKKIGFGDIGIKALKWKKWGRKVTVARGRFVTYATSTRGEPVRVRYSSLGPCRSHQVKRAYRTIQVTLNPGSSKQKKFAKENLGRHC